MVLTSQSDPGALEHILIIILVELPSSFFSLPCILFESWHCQCIRFHCYGTQYIWLHFLCHHFLWREDQELNTIQVKKMHSLFLWYHQAPSTLWSLVGLTLMTMLSRSVALCLQHPIQAHCCCHLLDCHAIHLPSTTSARVSNVTSWTNMSSRKIASGIFLAPPSSYYCSEP
jgi:hypothetical protein